MMLTLVLREGEAVVWLPGHRLASGNDPLGKGRGVWPGSAREMWQCWWWVPGVGVREPLSSNREQCSAPGKQAPG